MTASTMTRRQWMLLAGGTALAAVPMGILAPAASAAPHQAPGIHRVDNFSQPLNPKVKPPTNPNVVPVKPKPLSPVKPDFNGTAPKYKGPGNPNVVPVKPKPLSPVKPDFNPNHPLPPKKPVKPLTPLQQLLMNMGSSDLANKV